MFLVVVLILIYIALLRPGAALLQLRTTIFSTFHTNTPDTPIEELQRKLSQALEENERLRDLLQLQESTITHQWSILPAQVAGINTLPIAPFIILNRGANDGVEVGMPVVVSGTVLIGTIIERSATTSSILPLTHPNSRIAVAVQSTQRTIGILQGRANLSLELLLVPRDEPLTEEQLLITSGSQLSIPRGLLVGSIGSIDNKSANIFLEATVNASADPRRASTVGIITSASRRP